jgi:hypothetical protein
MTHASTIEQTEVLPATAEDGVVELVAPRHPELHGFHFKVRASGRVYRLESARDPQLPRFWCFSISRCVASGVIDESEMPWFGGDRMTRDDLPAAVAAIRLSLADWLALPQHRNLRDWVLGAPPLDASAAKSAATVRAARPS